MEPVFKNVRIEAELMVSIIKLSDNTLHRIDRIPVNVEKGTVEKIAQTI